MTRAQILARIRELLASDERAQYRIEAARRHGFLPLYSDWTTVLGLTPDGELVRWDFEDDGLVMPLPDSYWRRIALCSGAQRYPELAPVLPRRPPEAVDCTCVTVGPPSNGLLCGCGGLRWLLPGEPH